MSSFSTSIEMKKKTFLTGILKSLVISNVAGEGMVRDYDDNAFFLFLVYI